MPRYHLSLANRITTIHDFFLTWDALEGMYPWGVQRYAEFLVDFGVPSELCTEVDARLFMDLMTPQRPNAYHIRVEGRHTGVVMWVFVFVHGFFAFVGKHRLPNEPFERHTVVYATPRNVVSSIVQMYQEATIGRCFKTLQCKLKRIE
jgi:hypothetical protein